MAPCTQCAGKPASSIRQPIPHARTPIRVSLSTSNRVVRSSGFVASDVRRRSVRSVPIVHQILIYNPNSVGNRQSRLFPSAHVTRVRSRDLRAADMKACRSRRTAAGWIQSHHRAKTAYIELGRRKCVDDDNVKTE